MYNGNAGARNLLREIDDVSFAMDEVRLFLDTHPKDTEALANFIALRKKREGLLEEYRAAYGPICAYSAGGRTAWNWVEGPWPWEGEA
ncbi:MAG: spore coat protein CotJB [Clostridia bacterium]|nr:spore coat protein CotJB [Clostridia bacterium]